jgi:hypothetical protein
MLRQKLIININCCILLVFSLHTLLTKHGHRNLKDVNFFFDAEGVIHRQFVPEGQKVNAEFYVGVFRSVTEENSTS